VPARKCKYCNTAYTGRKDKIFCSAICKANYHRNLNKLSKKASFVTDKILHRNRSILFEFMEEKKRKRKVKRDLLAKKNFRFEYITGFYENAQGKRYHIVYDFAWMEFKTGEILVVRR